jgi:uncharacterized membrane protein YdbT with pleckstrin-like domain
MEENQTTETTMEAMGYQNFGRKAYWLFLSKWLEVPTAFLVIAIASSVAGRTGVIPPQFRHAAATVTLVCLGITILSAIICLITSKIVFNRQQFCLAQDAFKLRQGVINSREIAIPYRQIQNVEVERSFYQQIMGVSHLVISTAGEDDPNTPDDESRAVLENIDKNVAQTLQDDLLRKADVQRVVTANLK